MFLATFLRTSESPGLQVPGIVNPGLRRHGSLGKTIEPLSSVTLSLCFHFRITVFLAQPEEMSSRLVEPRRTNLFLLVLLIFLGCFWGRRSGFQLLSMLSDEK